jgi:hypothetical protein
MSLGRDYFHVLHADAAKFAGDKIRRFLHVVFMLVKGADAGDAEKIFQFAKKTLLIIADKIDCRGSHDFLPFWDVTAD